MPRVLIIDDDENVREILSRMLTRRGYEVALAVDGKEGIRVYREQRTDLVVTDIFMPRKEGFETIRELRAEFPEIKIIVMSGGGQAILGGADMYLHSAQEFGADCAFKKPIPREKFLAAVSELIGPGAEPR